MELIQEENAKKESINVEDNAFVEFDSKEDAKKEYLIIQSAFQKAMKPSIILFP